MNGIEPTGRSLLRQASLRLALALAVAVLALALLTFWIYKTAEDKAIAHDLEITRAFYQNKLAEWEEDWEMTALRYKARLEISGYLEDRENRWSKVYGFLTSQGEGQIFSHILISANDGSVLFRFGPEARYFPEMLIHTDHEAWIYQPETVSLFRAYSQPLWLGELGMGKLILLRKIDNALLFQNAHAHSHLSLMWDGKQVASCAHAVPELARIDEIELMWPGGKAHAPVLNIQNVNHPIFSATTVATSGLLVLSGFLMLLWLILGRWMLHITRRIAALGQAARHFSESFSLSAQVKADLTNALNRHEDEISLLARVLESTAEHVVQREDALQESEERFRVIADHTSNWENRVDPQGRLQWVNLMAQRMTGYSPQELYALGNFPLPLIHPDDREATGRHFAASVEGTAQSPLECRIVRKDGSVFHASVATQGIYGAEGNFLGHLGSVHDISVQKKLQQELKNALGQLQTILDNTQVGIAYVKQRRFVWINRRMEEMCGYPLEEIREQSTEAIYLSREDYEQIGREAYPLLLQGKPFEIERQMKRRNGQTFWCHTRGMAVNPHDLEQGSIWTLLDIDRRKAAEQALIALNTDLAQQVAHETAKNMERERLLVQQSRHAAMGEMIGNIAHQWRQPLSVLGLILQNIAIDFDDNQLDAEVLKNYVGEAMDSIKQMSATIDVFRDFFSPIRDKECFAIDQAVQQSLKLVGAGLKNNHIEIGFSGAERVEICGYPNEFAQVLLNLIGNAKDALTERMPGQPRIEVETRANMENRTIAVMVRDNGGGIPDEIAEKIFDPYFTTKGKGTGIGLYITKTIVERHMGGTISFRNHGEGVEFIVTLPLVQSQEEQQEEP